MPGPPSAELSPRCRFPAVLARPSSRYLASRRRPRYAHPLRPPGEAAPAWLRRAVAEMPVCCCAGPPGRQVPGFSTPPGGGTPPPGARHLGGCQQGWGWRSIHSRVVAPPGGRVFARLSSGGWATAGPRRAFGSSQGVGERRLRGRSYRRVVRGAYLPAADAGSLVRRCEAVQAALPDVLLSHWTAVALHGLPLPPGCSAEPFHVTAGPGRRGPRRREVIAHTSGRVLVPVRRHGLLVTGLARTWCDLARDGATVAELVVVGDALARRHPAEAARLEAMVGGAGSRRGVRAARRALALLDPRSESPMESVLRVALVLAGLPAPTPQHVVLHHGFFVARLDLAWPDVRLAVEYDGSHHLDRPQWVADLRRRERLEAAGWTVVVLTAEDVLGDLDATVARVASHLRRLTP